MPSLIQTDAIAGPFTLTYAAPGGSANPLGVLGPEGIRVMRMIAGEPIVGDQYGRETVLDGVYTGGTVYLEMLLIEANKAACKNLAYAFNETVGFGLEQELGVPGQLWSARCGVMVATPVAGTAAAAESTPIRTFSLVGPAMGQTLDIFLRAGLKTFPLRLIALPYSSGGKIVYYTRS